MLPLSRSGRVRAPWPPSSCARLLHPSSRPVAGMTSDQLGSARLSAAFAVYRPVAFTSRFPTVAGGLTTLLSIAQRRCRPTASSVCTLPLSLQAGEYPLAANHPAPGSYSAASRPISRTGLSPEPCRLSSRRFSISVVRLSTSRFSGPRRPGDHFRPRHLPHAQVCMLPLLMSPSRAA